MVFGPTLRDVVASFAELTGKMAFGPRWSLGFAQTAMALADAADAQERISNFIDRCGQKDIPISMFHFGSGYTMIGPRRYVFNWNKAKFPDPPRLTSKFAAANMKVVANLKPCLLRDHPRFPEVEAQGAFINDAVTGKPAISQFWDGEGAHIDFTNPAGVLWWQKNLDAEILGNGIVAAWNDNNEYEIWNEDAACAGFGQKVALDLVKPIQALLMTRASYEQQARAKPRERPFTITRAGCPGIQRYAQTWSGDNSTSWDSLRWNLRTGLQMSLSGMFNIGHDVAGFSGPVPEAELLVRFTQACALHPRFIMNSWKTDGTTTAPWMYPDVLPAVRWAIRLRYRMMPYFYSLYRRAATEGTPILRPTFFDFPDDPKTFDENDDFMVGENLLAAPVVERDARSRELYLPAGPAGWYDFYDGTHHGAGQIVSLDAPLERVPLLAPEGAILPLTETATEFSRLHDEPSRLIRLFPHRTEGESHFTLYEDDGATFEYRDGNSAELKFTMRSDRTTIRL
ncbi:MAG: DUF5110 domain-containing protein, partial [Pseudolabrys sp.]|nr:DUF5110 domain-containing protein [Pseudolabrys sp.]